MKQSKLDPLRAKASQRLDELEALLVILYQMTPRRLEQLREARRQAANTAGRASISHVISRAEENIKKLCRIYGARVSSGRILQYYREVCRAPVGTLPYIRKTWISSVFLHYGKVLPDFEKYPTHGFIVIHPGNVVSSSRVDWFLLEAKVFEDMCSLFNQYMDRRSKLGTRKGPIVSVKYLDSLWVATVSITFYFVEAYLNGLAADFIAERRRGLTPETTAMLTEWDAQRNRPKYLSLRDKALQYPKTVLGVAAPPLQESNCPELAFVCNRAKRLRDAVAHPSPLLGNMTAWPSKEEILIRRSPAELEEIVDNAVRLVQRIEGVIAGDQSRVPWLVGRDSAGYFPNSVFK